MKQIRISPSIFLVGFLFLITSCNKEQSETNKLSFENRNSNALFNIDIDQDVLSVNAYNEDVLDEYEAHGSIIYNHLKYRGLTPAIDYISSVDKNFASQIFAQIEQQEFNRTISEWVNAPEYEDIITDQEKQIFLEFESLLEGMTDPNLTFGELWYALRNWEVNLQNNRNYTEDSKEIPLILSSAVRNIAKYDHEIGETLEGRSDNCFLGRKAKCWADALGDVVMQTIIEAVKQSVFLAAGAAVAKKYVIAVLGAYAIVKVVAIYLKPSCRCKESGPACERPKGFHLIPIGCDEPVLEQHIMAWGWEQPADQQFIWTIQNGVFVANNSLSITTILPEVHIRQNNPEVPVSLLVMLECNQQERLPGTFNLIDLINDPGTVLVTGPPEAYVGVNYTVQYTLHGSWLTSTNTYLELASTSPHGQVTNNGVDWMDVKWNSIQPITVPSYVAARVRNYCSNQSASGSFNVKLLE
jgi:hypothetical protein